MANAVRRGAPTRTPKSKAEGAGPDMRRAAMAKAARRARRVAPTALRVKSLRLAGLLTLWMRGFFPVF